MTKHVILICTGIIKDGVVKKLANPYHIEHLQGKGEIYKYPDNVTDEQIKQHMQCKICFPKNKAIENYHGNIAG